MDALFKCQSYFSQCSDGVFDFYFVVFSVYQHIVCTGKASGMALGRRVGTVVNSGGLYLCKRVFIVLSSIQRYSRNECDIGSGGGRILCKGMAHHPNKKYEKKESADHVTGSGVRYGH